jgi:2,2-dialkylglycine decarboxylase (pyruvate)
LRRGLDDLAQRYEMLGDVRGRGMLIGLEFVHDRKSKRRNPEMVDRATKRAFELGLIVNRPGGAAHCWRIAPPLTIEQADIDTALGIMDQALRDAGAR